MIPLGLNENNMNKNKLHTVNIQSDCLCLGLTGTWHLTPDT